MTLFEEFDDEGNLLKFTLIGNSGDLEDLRTALFGEITNTVDSGDCRSETGRQAKWYHIEIRRGPEEVLLDQESNDLYDLVLLN